MHYNKGMNRKKSAHYIFGGMVSFFLLIMVCVIIRPAGLIVNSGISYYGNHQETLLPFALAFLVNSSLLWWASSFIGRKSKVDTYLGYILKISAILMIGIFLTPHNSNIFDGIHKTFGTTMFSLQIIMAITIVTYVYRDWVNFLLIMTALFSGFAALSYLLHTTGYMIEAQIIFQVSIWSIYIRYLQTDNIKVEKA